MGSGKRFVYVLKSVCDPTRYYTGLSSDLAARLDAHNAGRCRHTATGRPWALDIAIEFADEARAIAFESYLKSGSGFAFPKRHLRRAARTELAVMRAETQTPSKPNGR